MLASLSRPPNGPESAMGTPRQAWVGKSACGTYDGSQSAQTASTMASIPLTPPARHRGGLPWRPRRPPRMRWPPAQHAPRCRRRAACSKAARGVWNRGRKGGGRMGAPSARTNAARRQAPIVATPPPSWHLRGGGEAPGPTGPPPPPLLRCDWGGAPPAAPRRRYGGGGLRQDGRTKIGAGRRQRGQAGLWLARVLP